MPLQTFSWKPDIESQQSCKPSVQVTKFGDGYEARLAMGINTMPMKWSLQFTKGRTEALDIVNFLRARGAVQAFNWTNPLDEAGVYVCREWKVTSKAGGLLISCEFEQVFEA